MMVIDSVSSVLNKDNKMYGKNHMFDSSEESCWNSEQVSFVQRMITILIDSLDFHRESHNGLLSSLDVW
jgi:hypothetical protein